MSREKLSRRELFRGAATLAAASVIPAALGMPRIVGGRTRKAPRALRVAHITDVHMKPSRDAVEGFAACLNHLQAMEDAPQLLLNGGDSVFDAFLTESHEVKPQWKAFHSVYHANCSLPIQHCIGNHDVWGWNRASKSKGKTDPHYGKHWAMEELGLAKPYYSFDQAGWHFIVLDSVRRTDDCHAGYVARLDEEQFLWLEQELAQTPASTPIMIMSHCPILSVSGFFRLGSEVPHCWVVPTSWMHQDARRIKDLFVKHPNVKLCIAGHEHLSSRSRYLGVTYKTNGAVSGAWWGGKFQETDPGYGIIDLYADGTFDTKYKKWGWKARVV